MCLNLRTDIRMAVSVTPSLDRKVVAAVAVVTGMDAMAERSRTRLSFSLIADVLSARKSDAV